MEGKNKLTIIKISVLIFLIFSPWQIAQAASLYFSPSSGSYSISQNFSVSIFVSSADQAMNAASGTISFSQDKLQITSLSKSGSIFSLWVQEPVFSNDSGTANFEGIVLNPGFTGASGKIITINFKTKAAGSAPISFSAGSVLANDGKGTKILTSTGNGTFTISSSAIPPPEETPPEEYMPPPTPASTPAKPSVSSPSHPEENKWYSNKNLQLSWKLPSDITGVSLLLDRKPVSNPGPVSEGLIEAKSFENLDDGIWYFHIKFKNEHGWGAITHRKVLIDTVPPEPFEINVQRKDFTDPAPVLLFQATDALSGVQYYEIKIGQGEPYNVTAEDIKDKPYKMPLQAPGKYLVLVKAYDGAENFSSATAEIEILPIQEPVINKFPNSIVLGEDLNLEGKSLFGYKVRIFISKEGESSAREIGVAEPDKEGDWSFTYSNLIGKGEYTAWAIAQNEAGALSLPSNRVNFLVILPLFLKFGRIAIDYLTLIFALILLIIGEISFILYKRHQISLWRKRIKKETAEAEENVVKGFKSLHEEVQKQIELLDQKPGLTKEEEKIRDKLQESLSIQKDLLKKDLKDIEKELE